MGIPLRLGVHRLDHRLAQAGRDRDERSHAAALGRVAGIVSTLAASLAFGVGIGLYLLTEATWGGKPLAALYGYLGALGGGFWGMKGMEFATDIVKAIAERWASKQKSEGT
jgi:hypothetical protein